MDSFAPKTGYDQVVGVSILGLPLVTRLDEDRVVKNDSTLREIEALKFVAANTTTPVRRVYDNKPNEEDDSYYVVMDYMPGQPLDKVWMNLTIDQRASVCDQLAGYLSQPQKLKSHRIEAANGSSKEFNDFLARGTQHRPAEIHEIRFTHGDLSPRNILADDSGHIAAIVDWEWAGWFPEYWDVARIFLDMPGKKKMPNYGEQLCSALPNDYAEEFLVMLNVARLEHPWDGGVPVVQQPQPN
ncbi:hypothetical protein LOZ53_002619 [Ophidiomyces ophidiicola]|uniref:uncharacterized protein n=1 Tax=Ophidiomyces ophidiicola TaxID=1387563 RepID=UPI0020C57BC4|nr:uncharacterized protein LOZ57_003918 [Ophidiomyces ophidiicola]KAI1946166.1 hypothetical protein LOZ57_003918 [Ophidiomyces ophidiicola]KAI1961260.1 hypothetical protein LOZ59_002509 [Ophidiomyces ophidiicola]KAI1978422.1 hypothetical protein LOZ55_002751 [Ophidiomyces ophidiicola]KAI1992168.1 hypothetical protein LOZ53_002619 [Ophidiomyces ophidiicola]KAI2003052.1 hypothetical protein LOZ51_000125 [Ophidiomyces ophidiicola]